MGDYAKTRELLGQLTEHTCEFPEGSDPVFDEYAAKTLTVEQIRKRFPRVTSACIKCRCMTIRYASYAHYIYGDW